MADSLFRYQDEQGIDTVVSRIEDVPLKFRASVKMLTLEDAKATTAPAATSFVPKLPSVPVSSLPVPTSLLAGAAVACAILVGFMVLRKGGRVLRTVLFLLFIAGAMAAYLGFARQQAGLGGGLASPTQVIDDAKNAASSFNASQAQQLKTLDALEADDLVKTKPKDWRERRGSDGKGPNDWRR